MASKKMGDLQKAGSVMDKLFTEGAESVPESPEEVKDTKAQDAKKPASEEQKKIKTRKTDSQKVFSFRADKESVDHWRLWAVAKDMSVNDMGEKAMNEYIKRHSLTADQQKIYDLKKAQKDEQKKS